VVKRLRRLALVVLGGLVAGYCVVCALLFSVQRRITFAAPQHLVTVRDGSERVDVPGPGGTFFLMKTAPGAGPVVVHFHGNGDQVAYLSWLGEAWQRAGATFVAVEYPGYPGAGGEASEAAITDAAEAALVHLTTGPLKISRSRIVLEGQSLGTGVAVTMAARGWGVRLVLISPYTSLPELAGLSFPWLPTGLLLLDRFDSVSRAPDIKVPTLILHGTKDQLVPVELGQALCSAIPGARFFPVRGAHNQDLLDRDATQAVLIDFAYGR
jgi:uncharacterized protein